MTPQKVTQSSVKLTPKQSNLGVTKSMEATTSELRFVGSIYALNPMEWSYNYFIARSIC